MTTYNGTSGNDTLVGSTGDDTLNGGTSGDLLSGGAGNDLYTFSKGDGYDYIYDYGSTVGSIDTVQFLDVKSTEITSIDLVAGRLTIRYGTLDQLTVDYFSAIRLQFSDGVIWNQAAPKSQLFTSTGTPDNNLISGHNEDGNLIFGLAGNDTLTGGMKADRIDGGTGNDSLNGGGGNDTLIGGTGNDTLTGGAGNDLYTFSKGDGVDAIYEYSSTAGNTDTVRFLDVKSSEVTSFESAGDHLVIKYGTADQLTIDNFSTVKLKFSDGVTWNKTASETQVFTSTGTTGNDSISGHNEGNNLIFGLDGNDTLYSAGGSDTLHGGTGNDTLDGGAGDDTYTFSKGDGMDVIFEYGWSGNDTNTIEFLDVKSTEIVSIKRWGDSLVIKYGTADTVTITEYFYSDAHPPGTTSIELIKFSDGVTWDRAALAAQVFTSTGTENDNGLVSYGVGNIIFGLGGNDGLYGKNGQDTLNGGSGNDSLNGGAGDDLYTFSKGDGVDFIDEYDLTAGNRDTVQFLDVKSTEITSISQLGSSLALKYGAADQLIVANYYAAASAGIEQIKFSDGVIWNKTDIAAQVFTSPGTASNALTVGYEASNFIFGLDGNDALDGSLNNDRIDSGKGNDSLYGGNGNDTLDGGTGNDVMDGGSGGDTYYVDSSLDVVIEGLTSSYYDVVNSYLSAYTLGDNVENGAILASGTASLTGNSSSNTLYAGAGNNVLDGGAGNDTVSYGNANAGVTVSLATTAAQATGGSGSDTVLNVENLEGSSYADKLTGNAGKNTLIGGAGNDTLNGGTGDDVLLGYGGNDLYTFSKGDGRDHIRTYLKTDEAGTIEFLDVKSTEITFIDGWSNYLLIKYGAADEIHIESDPVPSYGYIDKTLRIGIEQFKFSDGVIWDKTSLAAQVFNSTGTPGNDSIFGGGRVSNVLFGLDGNDTLEGRGGNDTLYGGAGDDKLTSNSANDSNTSLSGGAGNDTLYGGTGNDSLNGGTGNDSLNGGDGNDTYYVDSSLDVVTETNALANTGGIDRVNSYLTAYTLGASIENGCILAKGTANLTGNELNNVLYAGTGNNTLDGDTGIDTASYSYASAGVTVSLSTTAAQATVGSGSDTLKNIENLAGSSYADKLTGNANNNALSGGAGNDILNGSTGNDILSGGADNDVLTGGLGADKLTGGAGADSFDFNALAELGLTSTTRDTITDFKTSEGDKIDLFGVDANATLAGNQAFSFLGAVSAFTGNATGQLRFDAAAHILYGSTDADTAAEFAIVLSGVSSLSAADFVL